MSAFYPISLPRVSVLIPCRNEQDHIGGCLESLLQNDYPHELLEVLVIDGMSEDDTRNIVAEYTARHRFVTLLDNRARIAPSALNAGLRVATGEIVMRMDAHVTYPPHYIGRLVRALEESGVDGVGCAVDTRPSGPGAVARAIALALSHPFGVGNSYFRIGASQRRLVDTVPFGCYRREIFARYGPFDEDLVRGQDEEFNFRVGRRGGRIMLVPEVVAVYFARRTLRQVARMYYQYGYFKPWVAHKVGRVMTVRQLVPATLLTALALSGVGALILAPLLTCFVLLLTLYAGGIIACTAGVARAQGIRCALALTVVFPLLHFSYGAGFVIGAARLLRRSGVALGNPAAVPLSR
jgi:cellulose synthase/poly-beta-1,6-N-acetylglucosamine synthase-like glycosyltransferase